MSTSSSTRDAKAARKVSTQQTYNIFRNWIWEIVSILVAVGLIIAIAALLATYEGRPTPNWGERINLNALLAVLSTILRAMLVVVASQIISQRKWEWFGTRCRRPLSDLQRFDSGSRGSLGAIRLLSTVLRRDPVTFTAANILFASFLVGPSIQQASRTTECELVAPNNAASLPFAHYVPRRGGYVSNFPMVSLGMPSPDLMAAIVSAITAPNSPENQIRGSCSTGNCTFPDGDPTEVDDGSPTISDLTTHSTVGMCNRCTDVSSLAQRSFRHNSTYLGGDCEDISLPNHFNVTQCDDSESYQVLVRPSPDLSWMGESLTPELKELSQRAYINATFLARSRHGFPNYTVVAAVCNLYPCVRTYTSYIRINRVFETNVRSSIMQLDMSQHLSSFGNASWMAWKSLLNYTAVKSPCRVNGEIYDITTNMSSYTNGTQLILSDFTDYGRPDQYAYRNITAPEQCIYRQHPKFVSAISKLLNEEVFDRYCNVYDDESYNITSCNKVGGMAGYWNGTYFSNLAVSTVVDSLYNNGYTGISHIIGWFDSFATSMTNRYRSDYGSVLAGADYWGNRTERPLEEIHGLAWRIETCVSMRRGWLLIPISLTTVTAILAIWTIAKNWNQRHSRPVWKDSILPLIFYVQDMVDQHDLDALSRGNNENKSTGNDTDEDGEKGKLLETREMETISSSTEVSLQYLYGTGTRTTSSSVETPTLACKLRKRIWQRRKHHQDTSKTYLLETHSEADIEEHSSVHDDTRTQDGAQTQDHQRAHEDAATCQTEDQTEEVHQEAGTRDATDPQQRLL